MSGLAARPRSPERLTVLSVAPVASPGGECLVTVTARYEPWCCDGVHETIDAMIALAEALENAIARATVDRVLAVNAGNEAPSYPYPADDDGGAEGWALP